MCIRDSNQPLLYRKRVGRVEQAKPGDMVAVYTEREELIGYGLYNPRSEIAVRMLWYDDDLPTDELWDSDWSLLCDCDATYSALMPSRTLIAWFTLSQMDSPGSSSTDLVMCSPPKHSVWECINALL